MAGWASFLGEDPVRRFEDSVRRRPTENRRDWEGFCFEWVTGGRNIFADCDQGRRRESDSWITTYKVKGVYAAQVETYLVQNFDMKRLKKSCCAWDGPDAFYSRTGEHFNIGMASDEDGPSTAFTATRADWRKLPFFYVTVEYSK